MLFYCLLVLTLWFSVFCILHSYLLYPLIVRCAAMGKLGNQIVFEASSPEDLPFISILMAAYNEEIVIEKKLETVIQSNYPLNKIKLYIGSDCSTDRSHELIEAFQNKYPEQVYFKIFTERQGKPLIINQLAELALQENGDHVFVITDANVLFSPQALFELVKHFKNKEISLVDSNIQQIAVNKGVGIAKSEKGYISREVQIKHQEGIAWGAMIGPLGGCYALRSTHFLPVPKGYLVDDFYIAMRAFEKGGKAVNELEAICYEDVSSSMAEEFKRKTRISTGNFMNLATFWHLMSPKQGWLAFAFISHKVLRWLGPFFILMAFICNGLLALTGNLFYQILFIVQVGGLFGIPLVDYLLKKMHINILLLRYISYFIAMNLALFKGFINYLKGVHNNVWEPTKRNLG